MQPDSKISFIPHRNNNEVVLLFNEQYCKKILTHCEKYLNRYIKFLVPPQESCCENLKKIFVVSENEAFTPEPNDTRLWLVGADDETYVTEDDTTKEETSHTAMLTDKPAKPATPKVCRFAIVDEVKPIPPSPVAFSMPKPPTPKVTRFAEVAEVVPVYEQQALIIEEPQVESAIKVKPFSDTVEGFNTTTTKTQKVKPFSGFKPLDSNVLDGFYFPTPDSKPKISLASVHQNRYPRTPDEKLGTPLTPSTPRKFPGRPIYTTQVSTVSTKSNTVSLYSCWPPPISIILISIIEIILFFINEGHQVPGKLSHGHIADALMYNPYRRKEVWRFVTYLFVHIGYQHLLFNLGIQVFLGIILEMVHERWRVLTIYFAGVLAGSLGTSVVNPRVKLAGASGGVYSLLTAHIVTVILKWKDMQYPATQLLGFMIIFGTDFVSGIYSFRSNRIEDIGYTAHFCGSLAGLLVGFPILRKLSQEKRTRWVQYVGLVIYLIMILGAAIWNIAATEYFPKQEI